MAEIVGPEWSSRDHSVSFIATLKGKAVGCSIENEALAFLNHCELRHVSESDALASVFDFQSEILAALEATVEHGARDPVLLSRRHFG